MVPSKFEHAVFGVSTLGNGVLDPLAPSCAINNGVVVTIVLRFKPLFHGHMGMSQSIYKGAFLHESNSTSSVLERS